MKIIYIPKGETVSYENLVTDRIVVKGCLKILPGTPEENAPAFDFAYGKTA